MNNRKIKIILIVITCIFSLSCQRLIANLAGPQGPVEALTQYANPIQETPNLENTLTLEPSITQESSQQDEPQSTDDELNQVDGEWKGSAQWLCDDNPTWMVSFDFKSNQKVAATLTNSSDTISADAPWVLNGDEIEIQFEATIWVGTITDNTMKGSFVEDTCSGVWSVTKEK